MSNAPTAKPTSVSTTSDPCEIEAVNYYRAVVMFEDGATAPITNWFDEDGDECDFDEATGFVAGPDKNGFWHSARKDWFGKATFH